MKSTKPGAKVSVNTQVSWGQVSLYSLQRELCSLTSLEWSFPFLLPALRRVNVGSTFRYRNSCPRPTCFLSIASIHSSECISIYSIPKKCTQVYFNSVEKCKRKRFYILPFQRPYRRLSLPRWALLHDRILEGWSHYIEWFERWRGRRSKRSLFSEDFHWQ